MSRVITFSRAYPAYHQRKGEPTFFPEKLFNSLHRAAGIYFTHHYSIVSLNPGKEKEADSFWDTVEMNYDNLGFKGHTIREGHRWKVGDKFSPRVWSGKPYHSKQIIIAPDVEIKKVWNFKIESGIFWILGTGGRALALSKNQISRIAANDGLSAEDFKTWFQYPKPFKGQIICWDKSINY